MSLISCIKSFPVVVIKRCFFLFLCLLSVNLVVAQNDTTYQKGYILVINAYTEATSWSSRMISTITRFVAEDPQLAVYTEHMNMMLIDDDAADLEEFKSALFERYGAYPPRLLLLLGDPALLLKEDFKRVWGDIPMVLCAEKDYTGPDEYYLHKEVIPQAERIPMTELADPYNLVLLYSDLYIRKNVELISQMTPDMKKFIFIGDERFINVTNEAEVREIIRKKYPHVEYEYLSPQILPINLLIDSLYRVDAKTTGILFSSWYINAHLQVIQCLLLCLFLILLVLLLMEEWLVVMYMTGSVMIKSLYVFCQKCLRADNRVIFLFTVLQMVCRLLITKPYCERIYRLLCVPKTHAF